MATIAMPKVSLMMWYDSEAERAAAHYVKAFKDGAITAVSRYPAGGRGPEGQAMTVSFTLAGMPFVGLNAGPMFKPTEALSIVVACDDQTEVDFLWTHLAEGGAHSQCGWLKDRWGFSWQVTPRRLMELMQADDAATRQRVFAAMMEMTKIDIAGLEKAASARLRRRQPASRR